MDCNKGCLICWRNMSIFYWECCFISPRNSWILLFSLHLDEIKYSLALLWLWTPGQKMCFFFQLFLSYTSCFCLTNNASIHCITYVATYNTLVVCCRWVKLTTKYYNSIKFKPISQLEKLERLDWQYFPD